MAEFVEFRAEEWIPELEQMERIRLFEPKEIKTLTTKRREFEYKIQRRTKCKEDFLKYIQFEVDLHRIIKARRKKTGINAKMSEIDHSQTHRIANLFKKVIFKFQNDIKLWMSFFKFCEGFKFHSLVSQMLVKMLQIHADKPDLWIFSAKWEFEQCKSVNNARQFLTKGLRHHPKCDALYQQLFSLELENIRTKMREIKRRKAEEENWVPHDEVTFNIIEGKLAEVVYESAVKAIEGVEFKVSLLNIAKEKKAPKNLINKIFEDIVKSHLGEELTWDTIAKREFEGFHCDLNKLLGKEEQMDVDGEDGSGKMSVRDRIQRSINVYEESVKKISSVKMWSLYLDFVISLNEDVKSLPVFKSKLLNNAMEGALSSGNLAEKYYLDWADRLRKAGNRNKKLAEVLKKGSEQHIKSLPLWHARLKFHLCCDQEIRSGIKVFNEAIEHVADSAPLWSLIVNYLHLKSPSELEEIIQKGVKRGGEVAQALKPLHIEWLVQSKGITEARRVFESPEMNVPPCLELYRKMASLELNQTEPDKERVRKCYELACANFGENESSVWLEYIKFELEKGDLSKISKIHRRALKTLRPDAADDFVSEFNNLKISLST